MTTHTHTRRGVAGALLLGGLLFTASATAQTAPTASAGECAPKEYAMALRYQQQSAEIQALQRQNYALATMRLAQKIAAHPDATNLAIMTDLDETVIDNSALLVRDMQACHDFTSWDTWKVWEREGHPRLIPGARAFLDYANAHGVTIFYVSDRYDENKAATLATLKALRLPQVNDAQVRLLGPSKAERRAAIERDYQLVLQLGDSLADFSGDFHHADLATQKRLVAEQAAHFGDDWIMFPNASYGSWSDATLEAWAAPLETN
ncbi:5'-nucleotidase, lipoprotein e(P4) family [Salinicola sp. DM10]|uniref:5'-nucleotidase, lipoprotein e(P4) family n=1 Tax=Salinicola sp. DM10 TaxID=2815721 RepID=UPI001A8E9130|nr:HAD family acid phosphatase [Salinicola sp. DM10]MCE3026733.1 5'-nucleotidase [Salinicola sp. DM10]